MNVAATDLEDAESSAVMNTMSSTNMPNTRIPASHLTEGWQAEHNLPRQRVTDIPITGEVVEWRGQFGWIHPHVNVDHEMASKRGGKIFLSRTDLSAHTS